MSPSTPLPLPLAFDTAGLEPLDEGRWFVPDTWNDVVVLSVREALPPAPVWLDGIEALRVTLARGHAVVGGSLLEAAAVSLGGVPALYTLVSERLPGSRTGFRFRGSFLIARSTVTAVLTGQFQESGVTGVRESMVRLRLDPAGTDSGGHPYDPELPYERSHAADWDPMFPRHALSLARAWARTVCRTAVVAPAFAALSPYRAA
ncbi:hypothetical protein ACFU7Z_21330 [Kitasatospora sp. NPDC057518]|uniref:hypothetical protein n=1 Tax=Kitasatospora sp. NPDC057518 TaxID=3346155 RepID=UPI0036CF16BF